MKVRARDDFDIYSGDGMRKPSKRIEVGGVMDWSAGTDKSGKKKEKKVTFVLERKI